MFPTPRALPWLASSVPLAAFVAGAAAHSGAGEEGAFIAAARELSVTHAPGAPLSTLVMALFTLVPVGPLSFRVALASALCAALTLALFSRALLATLAHLSIASERVCSTLALLGSWALAQTPLFFTQATRAQVFALQFALSMIVLTALTRFESDEPHGSTRHLYFAAFVQGLCFANHHVYGLLLLPVAAPTLGRVFAQRGFMGLMGHLAAPLLAFSAYLYVPLRLGAAPYGHGAGTSMQRVLAMLAAEPYWGPASTTGPSSIDALQSGLLGDGSARCGLALLLVLLGMYTSLRSRSRRRFGLMWLLALLVPLSSVSLVLRPSLERDMWGALVPCGLALTVFACVGLTRILGFLARLGAERAVNLLGLTLLIAPLWGLLHADVVSARNEGLLASALSEQTEQQLPPRALVFSDEAGQTFHTRGLEAEQALRPDVTHVPLAFSPLPHVIEDWAERTPELREALRDLVLHGKLSPYSMQSLASLRPVYLRLSEQVPYALYGTLIDDGIMARVLPDGVTMGDLRAERTIQGSRMVALYRRIQQLPASSTRADWLGRPHFYQALLRAKMADAAGAKDYLTLTEQSGWRDARVEKLKLDLEATPKVDVASYLPMDAEQ